MTGTLQKAGFWLSEVLPCVGVGVLLVAERALRDMLAGEVAENAYLQVLLFLINFHYELGNVFLGRILGPKM